MTPATQDTWLLALLGVIAVASLVQAVALVVMTLAARRGARRAAALEAEVRDQMRLGLARIQGVADDVTVLAHRAHRQVDRVEHVLDVATVGARKTVDAAGKALLPPLQLLALYKGVRRGLDIYKARRA